MSWAAAAEAVESSLALLSSRQGAGVSEVGARESRESSPGELVAAGLEAALGVRAPALQASTPMVRRLAVRIGGRLGMDDRAQGLVDLCARVRDVGMVGLPDSVLLADGALSPAQWELVNRHPLLGAELLERLPGLAATAEVVRAHHERWDGGGYPAGRSGEAIPLASRVIATADAFVAIASARAHRRPIAAEAALERVCQESGAQFDPRSVEALVEVLIHPTARRRRNGEDRGQAESKRSASVAGVGRGGRGDLRAAVAGFDVVAAFEPARERSLRLAASEREGARGELVAAIESDIGLTVAVLRRAQGVSVKRRIASVSDAVAALGPGEVQEAIGALPCAAFPWRTSGEALLHDVRVHGVAVARAVDRLARDLGLGDRDELIAAALLHDIGKLAFARVLPEYVDAARARGLAPEQRINQERRALGIDHASLGAVLAERWRLPRRLTEAISAHHSAQSSEAMATFVRLADMIARHAQGDTVDRRVMLRLAAVCGLPVSALRDVLFELPHAGGSQRRRAEPSPLSKRETDVLRALAEGKVYKQIGADLGLSTSTVRSHLHNVYEKLQVGDRAQAVLRATEMAWI